MFVTKEPARRLGRWWLGAFWQRLSLAEASGAVGDLGTFLPLTVALAQFNGLDLGTTLAVTGVYNIATGALFGIPMPVQPMKSIAAIALSENPLTVPQITAAGMSVSAIVLVLGLTRLIGLFNRMVPQFVVRGMQLGLGLKLAQKGAASVLYAEGATYRGALGLDGWLIGCAALLLLFVSSVPGRADPSGPERPSRRHSFGAEAGAEAETRPQDSPGALRHDGTDADEESQRGEGATTSSQGVDRETPLRDGISPADAAAADKRDRVLPNSAAGSQGTGGSEGPLLWGSAGAEQRGDGDKEWLLRHGAAPSQGADPAGRIAPTAPRGLPAALILVVAGLVFSAVSSRDALAGLRLGPSTPRLVAPSPEDWKEGFLRGAVPQLPLTTLNSVVAVCHLSKELFPESPAAPSKVSISVGLMNLCGGWLGAMPCCHGAGGLAAQVRFGARSGAAVILLGVAKLALGLLFGGSLLQLLKSFPEPILGSLLVFSGSELAMSARKQEGHEAWCIMLLTAAAVLLAGTASGFVAGLALAAAAEARRLGSAALARGAWPRAPLPPAAPSRRAAGLGSPRLP